MKICVASYHRHHKCTRTSATLFDCLNFIFCALIFLFRVFSVALHFLEAPCSSILRRTRSLRCKILPNFLPVAYFLINCFLFDAQRLFARVDRALIALEGNLRLYMHVTVCAQYHGDNIQIIYDVLVAFSFVHNKNKKLQTVLYS